MVRYLKKKPMPYSLPSWSSANLTARATARAVLITRVFSSSLTCCIRFYFKKFAPERQKSSLKLFQPNLHFFIKKKIT